MRIETLFSSEQIQERIRELARRIYRDYADCPLTVLCIADGAMRFVDDLLSELAPRGLVPERLTVRATRTQATALGPVQVESFDPETLDGRDVLVVDDVADAGETLRGVLELVSMAETRSVKTAVLIEKRRAQPLPVRLDYVGFQVESGWLIGYGMDVDGEYRELDWIGVLRDERF